MINRETLSESVPPEDESLAIPQQSDSDAVYRDFEERIHEVTVNGAALKTGFRWKAEKRAFNDSLESMFCVAETIATRLYHELDEDNASVDDIKQAVESFFENEVYAKIVSAEIALRLEQSVVERMREKFSRKRIVRKAGAVAVVAASSTAGYGVTNALFEQQGESFSLGGGVLAYLLTRGIQSQIRTGPTKVAAMLRGKAENIVEEYGSDSFDSWLKTKQETEGYQPSSRVDAYSAEKTDTVRGVLSKYVLDYRIGDDRDSDVADMISGSARISDYYLRHQIYRSAGRKPSVPKRALGYARSKSNRHAI